MIKKKLSVYDLKNLKGKRQISEVFVNNEEEAIAAEEAGIDIITAAYGMPQFGFNASKGYDPVSGLGTLNINNILDFLKYNLYI